MNHNAVGARGATKQLIYQFGGGDLGMVTAAVFLKVVTTIFP
jgi:hypothetical protein